MPSFAVAGSPLTVYFQLLASVLSQVTVALDVTSVATEPLYCVTVSFTSSGIVWPETQLFVPVTLTVSSSLVKRLAPVVRVVTATRLVLSLASLASLATKAAESSVTE